MLYNVGSDPTQPTQLVFAARRRAAGTYFQTISNRDTASTLLLAVADASRQVPDFTAAQIVSIVDPLQSYVVDGTQDIYGVATPSGTIPATTGGPPLTVVADVVPTSTGTSGSPLAIATSIVASGLALEIAQQIASNGVPLVAGPVPMYNIAASTSNPILFGCNNATFTAQTTAGVGGLTTAIAYDAATDGTNGWPASWPGPGGPFAAGVTVPTINIAPDIPTTLNGSNDALISAFLAGAPNGARIMPYHEANLPSNKLTSAQINALDAYLIPKVHAANPTLLYGRGLSASTFNNNPDPTWISPGCDFYGMDNYQGSNASKTPQSAFGPLLAAILTAEPSAKVHIIETGTALDVPTWFDAIADFAIANDLAGVQSYFSSGSSGQSQAWNNSFASALNTVSQQLASAGSSTTIPANGTLVLAPLNPSPVAAYAPCNSLSYDLVVKLNAGAGSTNPWLKLRLQWFDSDSANALLVAEQQWSLPMGGSATTGTTIHGVGPQMGGYLQIKAINTDSQPCTIAAQVNSISRNVAKHDWLWDSLSSVSVPGFTLPPDGLSFANCLGAIPPTSVPANSSMSWLFSMFAGQCYVRFGSGATSPVITVTMTPQPSGSFATLLDEPLTGQSDPNVGDFTGIVVTPRAPCLVTFTNSDNANAHNVSAIIIPMD